MTFLSEKSTLNLVRLAGIVAVTDPSELQLQFVILLAPALLRRKSSTSFQLVIVKDSKLEGYSTLPVLFRAA